MEIFNVSKMNRIVKKSYPSSVPLLLVSASLVLSFGMMVSIKWFLVNGILSSVNRILKNGSTLFLLKTDGFLVNNQEELKFVLTFLGCMKITEMEILLPSCTTCSTFNNRVDQKNIFKDWFLKLKNGLPGGLIFKVSNPTLILMFFSLSGGALVKIPTLVQVWMTGQELILLIIWSISLNTMSMLVLGLTSSVNLLLLWLTIPHTIKLLKRLKNQSMKSFSIKTIWFTMITFSTQQQLQVV